MEALASQFASFTKPCSGLRSLLCKSICVRMVILADELEACLSLPASVWMSMVFGRQLAVVHQIFPISSSQTWTKSSLPRTNEECNGRYPNGVHGGSRVIAWSWGLWLGKNMVYRQQSVVNFTNVFNILAVSSPILGLRIPMFSEHRLRLIQSS
jgi:hypothetical protein